MLRRIAVADLGFHSILYLLAQKEPDNTIQSLHHEIFAAPLDSAEWNKAVIQDSALAETIAILHHFKELAKIQHADGFAMVGTHVFRTIQNQKAVCDTIFSQTDLSLEILSGSDEARWSYWGAVHGRSVNGTRTVIDIGGGSTEIIQGDDSHLFHSVSLDMGAVTLTRDWIKRDPPLLAGLKRLEAEVTAVLQDRMKPHLNPSGVCIGVGGTGTTLAALALNLETYESQKVDGFWLQKTVLESFIHRMAEMRLAQRKAYLKLDPARADIILAGCLIMKVFMAQAQCEQILISDRGLRYGIALREFGLISNSKSPDGYSINKWK
jgi:exopolyphosphatase/guanosine-5'-triphosphate,3'-diphosphate pyrophosphatase